MSGPFSFKVKASSARKKIYIFIALQPRRSIWCFGIPRATYAPADWPTSSTSSCGMLAAWPTLSHILICWLVPLLHLIMRYAPCLAYLISYTHMLTGPPPPPHDAVCSLPGKTYLIYSYDCALYPYSALPIRCLVHLNVTFAWDFLPRGFFLKNTHLFLLIHILNSFYNWIYSNSM
jgi:hypothetical protein